MIIQTFDRWIRRPWLFIHCDEHRSISRSTDRLSDGLKIRHLCQLTYTAPRTFDGPTLDISVRTLAVSRDSHIDSMAAFPWRMRDRPALLLW